MIGSPEYDQASRIAVTSSTGNVTTTRTTTTSSLTRAVQIGSWCDLDNLLIFYYCCQLLFEYELKGFE